MPALRAASPDLRGPGARRWIVVGRPPLWWSPAKDKRSRDDVQAHVGDILERLDNGLR
jgi:hypothetical protein